MTIAFPLLSVRQYAVLADFSTSQGLVRGFAAVYKRAITLSETDMIIDRTKPLFAWDRLEDSPIRIKLRNWSFVKRGKSLSS